MKKKYFILIFIVIVAILSFSFFSRMNVLDRVYFAGSHAFYQEVNNALHVEWYDWDWYNEYEKNGIMTMTFDEEYLEENTSVYLTFVNQEKKLLKVNLYKTLSENVTLKIFITYDVEERSLTHHPIEGEVVEGNSKIMIKDEKTIYQLLQEYNVTEEDVRAYQEYALFEVIVRPWTDVNGGVYHSEKVKIEKCETVDNTFAFQ